MDSNITDLLASLRAGHRDKCCRVYKSSGKSLWGLNSTEMKLVSIFIGIVLASGMHDIPTGAAVQDPKYHRAMEVFKTVNATTIKINERKFSFNENFPGFHCPTM